MYGFGIHCTIFFGVLQEVVESQRTVWEDLGVMRPWWSVLSAEEYDKKRDLGKSKHPEHLGSSL